MMGAGIVSERTSGRLPKRLACGDSDKTPGCLTLSNNTLLKYDYCVRSSPARSQCLINISKMTEVDDAPGRQPPKAV